MRISEVDGLRTATIYLGCICYDNNRTSYLGRPPQYPINQYFDLTRQNSSSFVARQYNRHGSSGSSDQARLQINHQSNDHRASPGHDVAREQIGRRQLPFLDELAAAVGVDAGSVRNTGRRTTRKHSMISQTLSSFVVTGKRLADMLHLEPFGLYLFPLPVGSKRGNTKLQRER